VAIARAPVTATGVTAGAARAESPHLATAEPTSVKAQVRAAALYAFDEATTAAAAAVSALFEMYDKVEFTFYLVHLFPVVDQAKSELFLNAVLVLFWTPGVTLVASPLNKV